MTRIALVLGGGVSLGSYIGGALTELLVALDRNGASTPVRIHVLTGCSAGALNAALAARALAVNRHLIPWIETAWVDAADVEYLLNPSRSDRVGWLDVGVLDDLTRALVTAEPASDDAPASALGTPLRLGFPLANLDGVRYDLPFGFENAPDRSFGTRLYADHVEFEVGGGTGAADPLWEEIRRAALASAAFPFAFPPRRIARRAADYPGARLPESEGEIEMWYADGGLFDPAPLGLAKDLVERDPGTRDADWRYVVVEPALRSTGGGPSIEPRAPTTVVSLAARLTSAVLGQGAAQDWVRALEVNERVQILEELVLRLPEMDARITDPDDVVLGRVIGELAERVAETEVERRPGRVAGPDPAVQLLDRNLERIEADPRYREVLESADSRAGRSRLAKLVYVLEGMSGLDDKQVLRMSLVAPTSDVELAGDFMGGFGGFLHREWRAHDFRAGRRDMRRTLETSLADVVSYRPDADSEYESEPVEPSWAAIPPRARAKVESTLEAEAGRLLDEIRPGPVAGALAWAWKPVVRRWMTDRTIHALMEAR